MIPLGFKDKTDMGALRKRVTCSHCKMQQEGSVEDFHANFSQKEGSWVSYTCCHCGYAQVINDGSLYTKLVNFKGHLYLGV